MRDQSKYFPPFPFLKHLKAIDPSFITITKQLSNIIIIIINNFFFVDIIQYFKILQIVFRLRKLLKPTQYNESLKIYFSAEF